MKVITLFAIIMSLAVYLPQANAAPSENECKVHAVVQSPTGQLVSIVMLVGKVLEPVSGTLALATSAYRNSKCPQPRYITQEEADRMIRQALEAERRK